MSNTILDRAISPDEAVARFAERGIDISKRTLIERGKKLGAFRKIGQAVFFTPDDLERIAEPAPCSNSSNARKARSTMRAARSTDSASKRAPEPTISERPGESFKTSNDASFQPIPFRRKPN
ncbi:hypothetical protein [Fulvimarina manganoxydans]|uniref:hypothetical protein n=1 Tax=Fulvimarina manganoxydans TaxID=937218 RepID=UPI001482F92B|nr:hypothetical protein [Fulvimarina manganoxydans]